MVYDDQMKDIAILRKYLSDIDNFSKYRFFFEDILKHRNERHDKRAAY